jgi:hypothetical protein
MSLFRNYDHHEELVIKYFSFLLTQFGFTYTKYLYTSKNVKIIIELGHVTPRVFILKTGEPEFTRLTFDMVYDYFEKRIFDRDFTVYSLEQNIIFMADIVKHYINKIDMEINTWWLPCQLFQYNKIKEIYQKEDNLENFVKSNEKDIEYLKSKGVDIDSQ